MVMFVSKGAISDSASFRIVPERPNVGGSIRIIADGIAPKERVDFTKSPFVSNAFQFILKLSVSAVMPNCTDAPNSSGIGAVNVSIPAGFNEAVQSLPVLYDLKSPESNQAENVLTVVSGEFFTVSMALFPTESPVTWTCAKDSAKRDGAVKRTAAITSVNPSVCFDI